MELWRLHYYIQVAELSAHIRFQAVSYKTNNIMFTMLVI